MLKTKTLRHAMRTPNLGRRMMSVQRRQCAQFHSALRRAKLPEGCERLVGLDGLGGRTGIRREIAKAYSTERNEKEEDFGFEVPPGIAFAFDIDGVLLHHKKPIPGATRTLLRLVHHRIPFILLTNGGGKPEATRISELRKRLSLPPNALTPSNFVQSHTPFRNLIHLHDKTVLVMGSNAAQCRGIAETYGFKKVVIPADLLIAEPSVWPFEPLLREVYENGARPLPMKVWRPGESLNADEHLSINAIMVFNDPRDWALDIQLIVDLLMSDRGYLGTVAPMAASKEWRKLRHIEGQPELLFSNADLWWSTGYHLARFGQGAFHAALQGVWGRITDQDPTAREIFPYTTFGKPERVTYEYAERVLVEHYKRLHPSGPGLERVYMVGDNVKSDIAGANRWKHGEAQWESLLVRTGVFQGGEKDMESHARPTMGVVKDVEAAVEKALNQRARKRSLIRGK